jgi:hypothetical protein
MNYIGLIIFIGTILISNGCGTAGKRFDTSNAGSILNGTTTQSDIKKIFGEPFKTGIQNGQPGLMKTTTIRYFVTIHLRT